MASTTLEAAYRPTDDEPFMNERRDQTDDPRLDDVLAHIELRAAVELAKLGR